MNCRLNCRLCLSPCALALAAWRILFWCCSSLVVKSCNLIGDHNGRRLSLRQTLASMVHARLQSVREFSAKAGDVVFCVNCPDTALRACRPLRAGLLPRKHLRLSSPHLSAEPCHDCLMRPRCERAVRCQRTEETTRDGSFTTCPGRGSLTTYLGRTTQALAQL